jgi:hypothetical protein
MSNLEPSFPFFGGESGHTVYGKAGAKPDAELVVGLEPPSSDPPAR